MNFLCPSCKAKYKIGDDKVAGRNHARMKCKKCDFLIELHRQPNGEFLVAESAGSVGPVDSLVPEAGTSSLPPRPAAPPSRPQGAPLPKMPSPPRATGSARGGLTSSASSPSTSGDSALADEGKKVPVLFSPLDDEDETRVAKPGALAGYFSQSLTEAISESVPQLPPAGDEWFIGIGNSPLGPLTLEEVRYHLASGQANGATLAWKDGFEDWRPISAFPELAALALELPSSVRAAVLEPPPASPSTVAAAEHGRESWRPPKPSNVPKMLFLGACAALFVTVGFVVGKENPQPVIKYIEVPASVASQAAPGGAAPPSPGGAAGTAADPANLAADNNKGPRPARPTSGTEAKAAEEPGVKPASGGGLLSGLSGLQGTASGPQAGTQETRGGGGGQLDADSIQRTVSRYSPSVKRSCWQPALDGRARDAPSTARVTMMLTVGPDGAVQEAHSEGEPKGYAGLARCIEGRVRQWRFTASGGTTPVRIPFVFAAQ